jgi:ribosomal protein L11 methyltransferase
MRKRSLPVFHSFTLRVPVSSRDELVTCLWELDCCGIEEREVFEDAGKAVILEAWFTGERDPERLQSELARRFPGAHEGFRTCAQDPDEWLERYAQQFTGFAIDEVCYVHPPWEAPSPRHPVNLLLEPGHGFGTGTHESTQLALHCLGELARQAESMLDVGTGSGILSIAALKLNRELTVTALDIDPLAAQAAASNLLRNGVQAEVVIGGPECLAGRFDLVAANLTAPLLRALAGELARLTRRWLVVSGFTKDELPLVQDALAAHRLAPYQTRELQGWCAQVLTP